MATKRKSGAAAPLTDYSGGSPNLHAQPCEWPQCRDEGEFRAPRSRDELNTYRWFCLDHIREYNKSWNYYDGMSEDEVEEDVRRDTVWNRPTWQLGTKLDADSFDKADDPFDLFSDSGPGFNGARNGNKNGQHADGTPARPPISSEEERAYKALELEYPVTVEEVKIRYKSLVKEHHPDANKGAKESEERLKVINEAYSVLRATIEAL